MTIEEAREYWSRRLERASGYSDEHWDAEERNAHADYIDALKHAIAALAICREREEAEKPKTNGDRIRNMTDEELRRFLNNIADNCSMQDCKECPLNGACDDVPISMQKWIKQEVDPNDER